MKRSENPWKCHQCGYQFGLWLTMTLMISWATQLNITATSTLSSIKWIFWQKILSRYVADVCSTWNKLQIQSNRSFDAQVYTHNSCITESSMSRLSAKQNGHQNSKLLKNYAMCVQINLKATLLYLTAIPVELNLKFVETRGEKEIWLKMVLS